jgi:polysaccharide export outer membrane protein
LYHLKQLFSADNRWSRRYIGRPSYFELFAGRPGADAVPALKPTSGVHPIRASARFIATPLVLAALVLAALVFAMPATTRAQTSERAPDPVTLAPGDQLRIAVWGHPEFSGDFVIAPDGSITHPLLRDVKASGIPMAQLETRLRSFLVRFIADPAFVTTPLLHVFVGGDVRSPATYVAPPGTTIDQALLLAGGPIASSKLSEVVLVRDRRRTVLDLTMEEGAAGIGPVHSGDQILVPHIPEGKSFARDVLLPMVSVVGVLTGIANLVATLSRK